MSTHISLINVQGDFITTTYFIKKLDYPDGPDQKLPVWLGGFL